MASERGAACAQGQSDGSPSQEKGQNPKPQLAQHSPLLEAVPFHDGAQAICFQ